MTHATRGRVSVEVQGETYTLCASINALCELEDMTDLRTSPDQPVTFQDVLTKAAGGSLKHARAIYWALLQDAHPQMTLADVGNWMTEAGEALQGVFEQVTRANTPDPADAKAVGGRRRPQTARAGRVNGTGAPWKSTRGASA